MIQFFLRLLAKDEQDIQQAQFRAKVGKMSGAVGILCNLILAGSKLFVGIIAASVSITADALNNLSDAALLLLSQAPFLYSAGL